MYLLQEKQNAAERSKKIKIQVCLRFETAVFIPLFFIKGKPFKYL